MIANKARQWTLRISLAKLMAVSTAVVLAQTQFQSRPKLFRQRETAGGRNAQQPATT